MKQLIATLLVVCIASPVFSAKFPTITAMTSLNPPTFTHSSATSSSASSATTPTPTQTLSASFSPAPTFTPSGTKTPSNTPTTSTGFPTSEYYPSSASFATTNTATQSKAFSTSAEVKPTYSFSTTPLSISNGFSPSSADFRTSLPVVESCKINATGGLFPNPSSTTEPDDKTPKIGLVLGITATVIGVGCGVVAAVCCYNKKLLCWKNTANANMEIPLNTIADPVATVEVV
jgi:hypothetical protein